MFGKLLSKKVLGIISVFIIMNVIKQITKERDDNLISGSHNTLFKCGSHNT